MDEPANTIFQCVHEKDVDPDGSCLTHMTVRIKMTWRAVQ